jgi:hypothetical protein
VTTPPSKGLVVELYLIYFGLAQSFVLTSIAGKPTLTGALAQLGEHLLCKQGVIGSIPIRSTKLNASIQRSSGSRFFWETMRTALLRRPA